MNDKTNDKSNKNLFTTKPQSPKTRLIIAAVGAVALMLGIGGVLHHKSSVSISKQGSASLSGAPDIESVPGAGNPTNQYVKNQNVQNAKQAQEARKNATSNVPTITRPSFIGNPDEFGTLPSLEGSSSASGSSSAFAAQNQKLTCPARKVVVMYKPNPTSCALENLKLARQAGVTAEELLCQGCACPVLKAAGYTSGDLKAIGLTAKQLSECGFSAAQLVAAGFSANDLKEAGFSAKQLADAGFTPGQLADAGFSANEIKKAGFTAEELKAANIADCSPEALQKARMSGSTSAAELKQRGCSIEALKAAGFSPKQLAAAMASSDACSVENLKKARAAGVSATELKNKGCDVAALKAAGYTAGELKAAGFSAKQLKDAGYSAAELKDAGFSAKDLKNAGFSAGDLKDAGFSAADLKKAGYSAGQLKDAGYNGAELKDAGFSAKALHDAGLNAAELKAAGFAPDQLQEAGYSKGDLLRAGFTPQESGYAAEAANQNAGSAANANGGANGGPNGGPNGMASGQNAIGVIGQAGSQAGSQLGSADQSNPTNAGAAMPSINSPEGQLARLAQITQQQMAAQAQADMVQQMQGAMTMQAQKLLAGWSNSEGQSLAQAPESTADQSGAGAGQGGAAAAPSGPVMKAGTVMFAVLDTSVNSDEPSPIMARVVTGPLKGAKLLGEFQRVDKKVLLQFNLVNIPQVDRSVQLSAVAIDPDTARTAISGDVNNHYLLRYGTLFASAFLQGLGQAVSQAGTTENCIGPFCKITHNNLNPVQSVAAGMGTVGERTGDVMADTFNRPPTIKIPGGTGIGILIMADISLPGTNLTTAQQ